MTDTTIHPLKSMGEDEKPLTLADFMPEDVAAIIAASMQRMHTIAQKAEDGETLTQEEKLDYRVQSTVVQNTMLDYLRSDRCDIPEPARSGLIEAGEKLAASSAALLGFIGN